MSPRQIDVHPDAVAEARAAAQWYGERSTLAADAFLAELDRAVERISENPERYPHYVQGTRRYKKKPQGDVAENHHFTSLGDCGTTKGEDVNLYS